jgi:beta-phosphoglucomutase-like phosphatase (HAD superfamily)
MAASEGPVVVCSYPARDYAEAFVAELRRRGIATAVVPSDEHPESWDVLVLARDANRVNQIVDALLTRR